MPFCHNLVKETSLTNDAVSASISTNAQKWIFKKKIILVIVVLVVIIISLPFLFNFILELAIPITAITNVGVTYDNAINGSYHASFQLTRGAFFYTSSDGTVNIKITRDNNILYEKTFTVYRWQFRQAPTWGGSMSIFMWTFPASDVPGLPAPLTESVPDRPTNVMATITFTTFLGKTFTGTDDVFPYVDWSREPYS